VGAASQWVFQRCLDLLPWCTGPWRRVSPRFVWAVYAVYAGVFAFNLAITVAIGDLALASASAVVIAATLASLGWLFRARTAPARSAPAQGEPA
jgi:hypothetical protein